MKSPTCLLALALCAAPSAQGFDVHSIDLDPQPPWRSGDHAILKTYSLTIGDVDNDGVKDLVVHNSVAYLAVYFMDYDANGNWVQRSAGPAPTSVVHYNAYGTPVPSANCVSGTTNQWMESPAFVDCTLNNSSMNGLQRARMASACTDFQDQMVIYDIDMDGLNEILYYDVDHIPGVFRPTRYFLQVFKYDPVANALVPTLPMTRGGITDLDPLFQSGAASSCVSGDFGRNGGEPVFRMQLANVRGRAYPQDLVVSVGGGSSLVVRVFGFSGGTATLLFDISNQTTGSSIPHKGHNWGIGDVNLDGTDELVSDEVFTFDGVTTQVLWTIPFTGGSDTHPDSAIVADLLEAVNLPDASGNGDPTAIVPCPGMEVAVAPQAPGFGTGPWIYRGNLGHSLSTPLDWPRALMSFDPTFLYAGNPCPPAFFPVPGPNLLDPTSYSAWAELAAFLQSRNGAGGSCPQNTDPNPQDLYLGSFFPGGAELDLLVGSKAGFGAPLFMGSSYGFDLTAELRAVAHGGPSLGNLTGPDMIAMPIRFGCPEDPTMVADKLAANYSYPFVIYEAVETGGIPQFAWTPVYHTDAQGPAASYDSSSTPLFTPGPNPPPGFILENLQSATVHDVQLDGRDELIYWRRHAPSPDSQCGETTIQVVTSDLGCDVKGVDTISDHIRYRTTYAPWRNLGEYEDAYLTQRLPVGQVGVPYGIQQDPANSACGSVSGMIVPSQVDTPVIIKLVPGMDQLPPSLTAIQCADAYGNQVVALVGTPIEHGVWKIRAQMKIPGVEGQIEKDFYVIIEPATGSIDPVPEIVGLGFSGAYLNSGDPTTQQVAVRVRVQDGDANTFVVRLSWRLPSGQDIMLADLSEDPLVPGDFVATLPIPPNMAADNIHLVAQAFDTTGNVSEFGPFVVVRGGAGVSGPFLEDTLATGQAELQTPTLDMVEYSHDIRAAETSDGLGTVSVTVTPSDLRGMSATEIELRLYHPTKGQVRPYSKTVPVFGPGPWTVSFQAVDLPAGEIGWGEYGLNARLAVQDASANTFHSDWWPKLRIH